MNPHKGIREHNGYILFTYLVYAFLGITIIYILLIFKAEVLTGLPVTNIDDCKAAIKHFLSIGCNKVIITLGSKGAICATSKDNEPFLIDAPKVKAVDTTVSTRFLLVVR